MKVIIAYIDVFTVENLATVQCVMTKACRFNSVIYDGDANFTPISSPQSIPSSLRGWSITPCVDEWLQKWVIDYIWWGDNGAKQYYASLIMCHWIRSLPLLTVTIKKIVDICWPIQELRTITCHFLFYFKFRNSLKLCSYQICRYL